MKTRNQANQSAIEATIKGENTMIFFKDKGKTYKMIVNQGNLDIFEAHPMTPKEAISIIAPWLITNLNQHSLWSDPVREEDVQALAVLGFVKENCKNI